MSLYASEHASALADLRASGAAVTFTKTTPGTHDPATGTLGAPTQTSVSGYAIQVKSLSRADLLAYDALGLIPHVAPMLLFAATTYGDVPLLGAKCLWGGVEHTIKGFGDVVAPDGVPILMRPVIAT